MNNLFFVQLPQISQDKYKKPSAELTNCMNYLADNLEAGYSILNVNTISCMQIYHPHQH